MRGKAKGNLGFRVKKKSFGEAVKKGATCKSSS